jgi:predicted O-methyltransferase YrrM
MRFPPSLLTLGGLHSSREATMLADHAAAVPGSRVIIEVGSYVGASTLALAYGAASGMGARVVCIDPWPDPRPDERDHAHAERQRLALARFRVNMDEHGWPVIALRTLSAIAAPLIVNPVGMAFIDGDHSYRHVLTDVTVWGPRIDPGGVLVLHDYLGDDLTDDTDVARVVRDVLLPSGEWDILPAVDKSWAARKR